MAPTIWISAGEISGETHAAGLARALSDMESSARLLGMGGGILRAAGVETRIDSSDARVMGFLEVLLRLPSLRRLFKRTVDAVAEAAPDVLVLVDYPGFHMRLAKAIRRRRPEQRIVWYICPKFWAWNRRRVHALRRQTDRVLCIFPFEPPLLEAEGVDGVFVGNPLLDESDLHGDGESLRSDLAMAAEERMVGLLPGSRENEIRLLLPPMLDATERLPDRNARWVVPAAPGFDRAALARLSGRNLDGVDVVEGRAREVMTASSACVVAAGTATLETALAGTPLIAVYRTSAASAWIARRVMRVRHVSLPNIIAREFADGVAPDAPPLVPELLQEEVTGERIAEELARLLDDDAEREKTAAELASLRETLGGPGASERAAREVLDLSG